MGLTAIFRRFIQRFHRPSGKSTKDSNPLPGSAMLRSPVPAVGVTFYSVYIPSLDGRFDYLSTTDYPPGQAVIIPFGPEDREIMGIVEGATFYPYEKMPLPLWKMKYILDKAPEPIAEAYRRQTAKTSRRK